MTGIVNSTGARSGVIGTTVGTPAAGSTDASDLDSGILAALRLPTGAVISTNHKHQGATGVGTSNTAYEAGGSDLTQSFTAIQTNGHFLIHFHAPALGKSGSTPVAYGGSNSNKTIAITLYKSENGGAYAELSHIGTAGLSTQFCGDDQETTSFITRDTASITAGQSIAYQIYIKRLGGGGGSDTAYLGANCDFVIQEIKL